MSERLLSAAALQMVSSDDCDENLETAARLIDEASRLGARVVVLPENFAFMGRGDAQRLTVAEPFVSPPTASTPLQAFLSGQASAHRVWLIGGTIPLAARAARRAHSAMLVFAPDGECRARYDKIHLFDVDVPGGQGQYRESASTLPGEQPASAPTGFGQIGLAVCYDVRFPELFRRLAGPELAVFALASAFTTPTGAAHWETLVRARAIENLTAVVAASQGGAHTAGRETYGHSMIVDAWGRILARQAVGEGVIIAEIDLQAQRELRRSFPVLEHRRLGRPGGDSHLTGHSH